MFLKKKRDEKDLYFFNYIIIVIMAIFYSMLSGIMAIANYDIIVNSGLYKSTSSIIATNNIIITSIFAGVLFILLTVLNKIAQKNNNILFAEVLLFVEIIITFLTIFLMFIL